MRVDQFNKVYGAKELTPNVFLEEITESLTGRVMSIRASGAKLMFIDMHADDHKVQIMANANSY